MAVFQTDLSNGLVHLKIVTLLFFQFLERGKEDSTLGNEHCFRILHSTNLHIQKNLNKTSGYFLWPLTLLVKMKQHDEPHVRYYTTISAQNVLTNPNPTFFHTTTKWVNRLKQINGGHTDTYRTKIMSYFPSHLSKIDLHQLCRIRNLTSLLLQS